MQEQGAMLTAELQDWPIKEGSKGKAFTLRYLKEEQSWERLADSDVLYNHPDTSDKVHLYLGISRESLFFSLEGLER